MRWSAEEEKEWNLTHPRFWSILFNLVIYIWGVVQHKFMANGIDSWNMGQYFAFQYGKVPAHEGPPLKSVLFTLHHNLIQEKEPKLQKATMMSMKVHVSSLHAPIYWNFYLCVGKWNKFKHFDVERPLKVCAPMGLPVHRRRNYRAN